MLRLRRRVRAAAYPVGSCTETVWQLVRWVPYGWGDALQWPASAYAAGLVVCDQPVKNALAVWPQGKTAGPYGHVAAVVQVDFDGAFAVLESNPGGQPRLHEVHYGPGAAAWFIHPPADPFTELPAGTAGAGRGAGPDRVLQVLEAWDGLTQYWNYTAPQQSLRAGIIAGMFAGLL